MKALEIVRGSSEAWDNFATRVRLALCGTVNYSRVVLFEEPASPVLSTTEKKEKNDLSRQLTPEVSRATGSPRPQLDGSAHSPGPWTLMDDATFSTLGDKRIVAANRISPAIVFGGLRAETDANARLIAAAPELLDALKALADACFISDSLGELPPEIDGLLLDAALRAISKAVDEQPLSTPARFTPVEEGTAIGSATHDPSSSSSSPLRVPEPSPWPSLAHLLAEWRASVKYGEAHIAPTDPETVALAHWAAVDLCADQLEASLSSSSARRAIEFPALQDVVAERVRQDAKWGEQNHDPFTYLTVLIEEVGELAQAALHARFGGHAAPKLREEAVQTAAVALAIVECLDRGKWTFRSDVDNSGMPLADRP